MTLKLNDNAKRQTELSEILKLTLEAISESLDCAKLISTLPKPTINHLPAAYVLKALADEKIIEARHKLSNLISLSTFDERSLDSQEELRNLHSALQALDTAIKNL